jgi:glycosyltransferase involved in cell wall biosynthesis
MSTRTALLIPSPGLGGIEIIMGHLANALTALGHPADLLTLSEIPLRRLPKHLRDNGYSTVIAAKERANFAAVLVKHLRPKLNIVLTRHVPTQTLGDDSRWSTPLLYRHLYRNADAFVAVSEGLADELRDLVGPARAALVHALPNPVIGPNFHSRAQHPIDHPFSQNPRPVVVSVGRLAAQKGLDLFIDTLVLLPQAQRPLWWVVGDGPERAALQTRVHALDLQDGVAFLGAIDNPLPWMVAADALVLPSHHEGLPTVLIEALTLGTPCVAMDCPTGPAQIAKQGGRLVLVSDRSPRDFGAAVLSVLHEPEADVLFDESPYTFEAAARGYLQLIT